MPRRRSASPRASGPVRRMTPPPSLRPPAPSQLPPPPHSQQRRQPGLLGQMAATAGGVAIGSAIVSFLAIFVNEIYIIRFLTSIAII